MPEDLVAVLIVACVMLVPIVTILTKHQQRMAELFRGDRQNVNANPVVQQDNEALRRELAEVKQLLYEQSIAIDNLARSKSSGQLSDRLEEKI